MKTELLCRSSELATRKECEMLHPRGLRNRSSRSEDGASAVEYGLLVALIAGVIVLAVFALGNLVTDSFEQSCTKFKTQASINTSANC